MLKTDARAVHFAKPNLVLESSLLEISPDRLHPDRLLSPADALKRFRPATIQAVAQSIYPGARRFKALMLMRDHFPDQFYDVIPEISWLDIIRYFFRCVEAENWFEIDWWTLDHLYHWAQQDYPETKEDEEDPNWEPDGISVMAETLNCIPIRCFGFDEFEWNHEELFEMPPVLLLNCLLTKWGYDFDKNFPDLAKLGGKSKASWKSIEVLDTAKLPEPLCWLPDMARYACAKTGNPVLDTGPHFEKWSYWPGGNWYTWDKDLERAKADWQAAQEMRRRAAEFVGWANTMERLEIIFKLVTDTSWLQKYWLQERNEHDQENQ